MKDTKTITILYSIPSSGKTTYANELKEKSSNGRSGFAKTYSTNIIDLDTITKKYKGEDIFKKLNNKIVFTKYDHFVIDGLITTNLICKKIIDYVKNHNKKYDIVFNVVWWEKDIDACLHNDIGRRKESSTLTIKNIKFEEPDYKVLGINKENIMKKQVVKKSDYQIFIDINDLPKDGKICSNTWSLGGSYGTCWDNEQHPISAEQPVDFIQFDNLLEKLCPDITFLKYKILYNSSVKMKEKYNSDYYGGGTTDAWYECDLKALYEKMIEMKLINVKN